MYISPLYITCQWQWCLTSVFSSSIFTLRYHICQLSKLETLMLDTWHLLEHTRRQLSIYIDSSICLILDNWHLNEQLSHFFERPSQKQPPFSLCYSVCCLEQMILVFGQWSLRSALHSSNTPPNDHHFSWGGSNYSNTTPKNKEENFCKHVLR